MLPSFSGYCFCCRSVAKSCLTLWDHIDCSKPGFPVSHHLPEFAQVYVHWISDAIRPSHPLLPSSPAFNLSQYQGLFQWVGSLRQVARVLELRLQSFQWIFRIDFLLTSLISLLSRGLSRGLSNTTVREHQFFGTQPSLRSNSHIYTWLLEKP